MVAKTVPEFPLLSDPDGSQGYVVKGRGDYRIVFGQMAGQSDSPHDGKPYSRKDGSWEEIVFPEYVPSRKMDVADETERLSINTHQNLTFVRQIDTGEIWTIEANLDPSVVENWSLFETPAPVESFNGRIGEIVPTVGDYTADQITETDRKFVTITQISTWNLKQSALVSGSNIKTINGQSILGSGDLVLTNSDVGAAPSTHNHNASDITDFNESVFGLIVDTLVVGDDFELDVSTNNKTITIKDQGNDSLLIWQGI